MQFTYQEFIQHIIDTRGRFGCGDEYHERHHIIPKSLGGTNDDDNLIDLFANEHYNVHKLLAEENPDNKKILSAFWMMSHTRDKVIDDYIKINAEEYEQLKIKFSNSMKGENNPMYGKHSARLGVHLTEEQKQHLRDINSGSLNPKYGKPLSEETKEKIRLSHIGKRATDEVKKNISIAHIGKNIGADHPRARRIAQYDLNGNFIRVWECIEEAAKEYHVTSSAISNACSNLYKTKSVSGYQFRYIDGDIIYKIKPYVNQSGKYQIKTIARCDEEWNIIDIWNGCKDASQNTGISASHISQCCNGKRQHAGGYRWKIL